jgi:SAM-dependent methyltransferase
MKKNKKLTTSKKTPASLTKNPKISKNGKANKKALERKLGVNDMPKQDQKFYAFQSEVGKYEPKIKHKRSPVFAICIPYLTKAKVSMDWARGYKGIQGLLGCTSIEVLVADQDVATARNMCVRQALDAGADYCLFIGSDVLPPGDILSRLLAHGKDISTGVYWTKAFPTRPYIWRGDGMAGPYMDWKYGEFFKIQYSGVDAALINCDVFRNLSEPWFSTDWNYDDSAGPQGTTTEDFYFYEKAAQAGYDFWCDSAVQCLHQDRNTGAMFGLTSDMVQMMNHVQPNDDKLEKIADIRLDGETPLSLSLRIGDKGVFHRFDIREEMNPDFRCDPTRLAAKSGTYDLIHIDNVIEYFEEKQVIHILRECFRIVKPHGEFELQIPDPTKMDYLDPKTYKYKCGITKEQIIKLIKLTKMAIKVECETNEESNVIRVKGKIKTNRKWEILKEEMEIG